VSQFSDSHASSGAQGIPEDHESKRQKKFGGNMELFSQRPSAGTGGAVVASTENVAQIAQLAALERFRNHQVKLPWEKGPLAPIFGGPLPNAARLSEMSMPNLGLLETLAPPARASNSKVEQTATVSNFVVKRIARSKVVIAEDELLAKSLNQIKTLLLLDLTGSEVGMTMTNLAGGLDESVNILQVLKDCFARKSTATVLKRTSAVWMLTEWLIKSRQVNIWNMSEQNMYDYMCYLRESAAAPTRASHVIEALNFFESTLHFKHINVKSILSSRVQGASHAMYVTKRKLKQAPQLSVSAVQALETICVSEVNLLYTLVSGALLFCVFACARWSDCMRLENVWVDRFEDLVIVEGETSKHKTSKSKESQSRLLPFTALGRFKQDKAWGESFVAAWKSIQLDGANGFVPSCNDRSGTWATSPMTTSEASYFMHELLEDHIGPSDAAKYSTHSCKPTLLTWCAMTDLFTREERTMLGHHIEPTTKAATTYNRDSQLMLQSKISKVLDLIVQGTLVPDASRAERLFHILGRGHQSVEEVSSESDCEDVDLPSIHSKVHHSERQPVPLGEPDEYSFVSHKLTGTVHVLRDHEENKLACGRKRTINLVDVAPTEIDAATAPFCIQCSAVIKSLND